MNPVPVGTLVRVISSEPFDDYTDGQEIQVHSVDPSDGTFRGRDPETSKVGGWLRWNQVEPAHETVGWPFLQRALSKDALELLAAFEGTKGLRLKVEVIDAILLGLPDLEARIREEARALASGSRSLRRRRRPTEPRPSPLKNRPPRAPDRPEPDEPSEDPAGDLDDLSHLFANDSKQEA